jgi:hypothetical protein
MVKLVKHGSQGVDDGSGAKDSFDMPETLPQSEAMDVSKNTALYDKEAVGKNVLPELNDAVDDVAKDNNLATDKKGMIGLQQDAGSPDTPVNDADMERFANQGTPDYEGQKEGLEDGELLKKAVGHKTPSGL